MTPWEKYQQDLTREDFKHDPAQETAVRELQRLYEDLLHQPASQGGFANKLKSLFGSKPAAAPVQGIYFYGGVGRGKTYLVDTFFQCLPFENKMRVHFHRFMHRVHEELKLLGGKQDPLEIIATKLAGETRIICFDEFFVSDITDAMILGTLMEALFAQGIVLVATSNIVPDELYRAEGVANRRGENQNLQPGGALASSLLGSDAQRTVLLRPPQREFKLLALVVVGDQRKKATAHEERRAPPPTLRRLAARTERFCGTGMR